MSNVACDVVKACLSNHLSNRAFSLVVPYSLRLIPLYMLSMIKSVRSKKEFLLNISFLFLKYLDSLSSWWCIKT
jgi:hypothetical protein